MAAKAVVLQLAGIAGLSVLLYLLYSSIENAKGVFNGCATSVLSCPACPEVKFNSVTTTDMNDNKENEPKLKMKHFVYVYDLGSRYTTDVLASNPTWYDIQYDGDKILTQALMESNKIRTMDPEIATLFYVPFYAARFTMSHCKNLDRDMAYAINKTSEVSSACQLSWRLTR